MANTDKTGKKGGAGGGEFALQANQWHTPSTCDRGPESKESKATLSKNARPLNEAAEMNFPSSLPAPATEPPGQPSSQGGLDSHRLWSMPREKGNRTSAKAMTERTDGGGGTAAPSLEQQATGKVHLGETKKRLNPNFVDWLMGYPIGHSDSNSTGIASSLSAWRRRSSACLRRWLKAVTE